MAGCWIKVILIISDAALLIFLRENLIFLLPLLKGLVRHQDLRKLIDRGMKRALLINVSLVLLGPLLQQSLPFPEERIESISDLLVLVDLGLSDLLRNLLTNHVYLRAKAAPLQLRLQLVGFGSLSPLQLHLRHLRQVFLHGLISQLRGDSGGDFVDLWVVRAGR